MRLLWDAGQFLKGWKLIIKVWCKGFLVPFEGFRSLQKKPSDFAAQICGHLCLHYRVSEVTMKSTKVTCLIPEEPTIYRYSCMWNDSLLISLFSAFSKPCCGSRGQWSLQFQGRDLEDCQENSISLLFCIKDENGNEWLSEVFNSRYNFVMPEPGSVHRKVP